MQLVRKSLLILPLILVVLPVLIVFQVSEPTVSAQTTETTPGALMARDAEGNPKLVVPLKHTSVKAEITGFISRVQVTQEFENPFQEKIEAVYTFPLPQNAAVDDMTMNVGERTIRGKILPREDALAVYEGAKARGQVASLLDQERPNIFTQSVANILPGEQIKITISYVETLRYDDGEYEFVFPMVVGPRYIPRTPISISQPLPFPADKNNMPDLSRLVPPRPGPGERSGHDISIEVSLDAGVIIERLESKTHAARVERPAPTRARVTLEGGPTIPNKDFILRYDVAGKTIQDGVLAHRSDKGGFFSLILQPPERVTTDDVTPKELIFVLDTSGSMQGNPIEKAKETMKLALDNLYPDDTFNVITFSGDTRILFDQPVRATKRNLRRAQDFLAAATGYGGTEMMTAIKAALEPSDNQSHVRVVCFMTDGFVGNDMEIIAEVQKHNNARVFAFGIGSSVNRFLLDNLAAAGRGEVEYVGLGDDGSAAAKRFHQRVRNPLLTDISIEWNDLPVTDIYPKRIPDLFGAKPVIVTGRYTGPASGTIRLKGNMAGSQFTREIQVSLPETMALHDVLAPLWARARIDNFMTQDYLGVQLGTMRPELREAITQLSMEFRLLTQFTSFVAVEEMVVNDGGTLRRIDVPVEVPEGVNQNFLVSGALAGAGGGGPTGMFTVYSNQSLKRNNFKFQSMGGGVVAGKGGGSGSGVGSGTGSQATVTKSGTQRTVASGVISGSANATGGGGAGGGGGSMPKPTAEAAAQAAGSANALMPYQVGTDAYKSPEQQKFDRLRSKMHPTLLAIVHRVKQIEQPSVVNYGGFVRAGKAELQLWFNTKSDEALAKLKELGFEVVVDHAGSNLMIGRIPINKLDQLAELEFIRYVSPQISR